MPHWRNRIARSPSKREAAGSSPAWGTNKCQNKNVYRHFYFV